MFGPAFEMKQVMFFLNTFDQKLIDQYQKNQQLVGHGMMWHVERYDYESDVVSKKPIDYVLDVPMVFLLSWALMLAFFASKLIPIENQISAIILFGWASLLPGIIILLIRRQIEKGRARECIRYDELLLGMFQADCERITRFPYLNGAAKFDERTVRMNLIELAKRVLYLRKVVKEDRLNEKCDTGSLVASIEKHDMAVEELNLAVKSAQKFGLEFDMEEIHAQALPLNETSLTAGSSQA